jgi:hypothetical protein
MAGIFLLRWVSDFFQGHPEAVVSALAGFVGGNGFARSNYTSFLAGDIRVIDTHYLETQIVLCKMTGLN